MALLRSVSEVPLAQAVQIPELSVYPSWQDVQTFCVCRQSSSEKMKLQVRLLSSTDPGGQPPNAQDVHESKLSDLYFSQVSRR